MYLHEQIAAYGSKTVSDLDLLAIVAGVTTDQIRLKIKSILDVRGKSHRELQNLGFTKLQAARILAAVEVGNRSFFTPNRAKIATSNDCFLALAGYFAGLKREKFFIMLLNRANKILTIEELAQGSARACIASSYEVIRAAIAHNAHAVVIAHNHPSGEMRPSSEDLQTTRRIKSALALCEIELLDSLIIHENTYYSLADTGNL